MDQRVESTASSIKLRENPEHGSNQLRRAGSGWKGEDGAISISLDPGVVLDHRLSQEAHIMLFPADEPQT